MRLIDADAFDSRVREAVGTVEGDLTDAFKDGIRSVLEMLKSQPDVRARRDTVEKKMLRYADPKSSKAGQLIEAVMGMASEVGEASQIVRKAYARGYLDPSGRSVESREDGVSRMICESGPLRYPDSRRERENLLDELADMAYFLAVAADALSTSVDMLMWREVRKLKTIYPEGWTPEREMERDAGKRFESSSPRPCVSALAYAGAYAPDARVSYADAGAPGQACGRTGAPAGDKGGMVGFPAMADGMMRELRDGDK